MQPPDTVAENEKIRHQPRINSGGEAACCSLSPFFCNTPQRCNESSTAATEQREKMPLMRFCLLLNLCFYQIENRSNSAKLDKNVGVGTENACIF